MQKILAENKGKNNWKNTKFLATSRKKNSTILEFSTIMESTIMEFDCIFPTIFAFVFSKNVLHPYLNVLPGMCCSQKMIISCCSQFFTSVNSSDLISLRVTA